MFSYQIFRRDVCFDSISKDAAAAAAICTQVCLVIFTLALVADGKGVFQAAHFEDFLLILIIERSWRATSEADIAVNCEPKVDSTVLIFTTSDGAVE